MEIDNLIREYRHERYEVQKVLFSSEPEAGFDPNGGPGQALGFLYSKAHCSKMEDVHRDNLLALNNVRDFSLGYSAVFAPTSTSRGSGLAVVVAPGVTVLWHRVLWPGKIAIASINIRGLEIRVIAEEAIREDAWALDDFNISEESSSSGAAEALADLLDLVDTPIIFNVAHVPTKVASYGSRVDAARLDRLLIPSRLSGRVTCYWTLEYSYSDHRAILIQVGDPSSPSAPSIYGLPRSALVIERRYWPISLPTADYIIVSGIFLGRLRRHLPPIVPECQTNAVPGRCLSWACVSDEVALAFKNKSPLAVISTDLQSAFDSVDREFLAYQLRSIGLPPPFVD
ncbi:hypothetical protein LAZ67_9002668 [Cordylochernes scorpioides]|uniref:Reverse transcriptase domain-containing protein n=1 Tax=Cordylochernes scorpioides TaxID=51811 RepID=A0ABY6KTY6_9ARAC|nr:hypothetical protein LAZ67_9002668 [Cordylochernes scorpioides]